MLETVLVHLADSLKHPQRSLPQKRGYTGKPPPLVRLLSDTAHSALQGYKVDSYTRPPIDKSFKSPFIGWDIVKIGQFLEDNAQDTAVEYYYFLIADERTNSDKSLLFVDALFSDSEENGDDEYGCEPWELPLRVRLAPEFVNGYPAVIAVGCMGTNELACDVDEDGVYRGESWEPPAEDGSDAEER